MVDPPERLEELEQRVRLLEREVELLRSRAGQQSSVAPAWPAPPRRPPQPQAGQPPQWAAPAPPRRAPTERRPLVVESEAALKWGGVALVVLAVGFAVSTAIRRGWIGPELQLLGAVMVALALIGVGLRLRGTRPGWTHALCTGGVLALFTIAASDLFVDQTTRNIALGATAMIVLGGYGLALAARSQWVGTAALVGGEVGWLVIAGDDRPFASTLLALVVTVALAGYLALGRGWFAVRFSAQCVALVGLLAAGAAADRTVEEVVMVAAVVAWAVAMARIPSIGDLESVWQKLEIHLATAPTPWAVVVLAVTFDIDGDTIAGSLALAVAVVGLILAVVVRGAIKRAHLVSQLIGVSVTLSFAAALLLSPEFVVAAIAVQGGGLVVLGRVLDRDLRVLLNGVLLASFAGLFGLIDMIDAWSNDVPLVEDLAHLLVVAAILVGTWQSADREWRRVGGAAAMALSLVWLGSLLVHLPQGQAAVSISWAAVGTASLVVGAVRKVPDLGFGGLAVLALTVGKLLSVDLREVDTLWRAGLFLLVGLGLMRLGFLLPRLTGTTGGERDGGD